MAVTLSLFAGAGAQFFDTNGNPLSGGKIYTYFAGTTTPLATYIANSDAVAHTNPIVLDAAGRVPSGGEIWLTAGIGYKFVIKTSADVLIATYDNIPSSAQPPAANDADSIMYEQGYTVAAGSFVIGKMYRILTVGTTDFTLIGAISNAIGLHFIATGVGSGTGTAELSQTVESKLRQSVSVEDFGAVGDGVADDTNAIQAAINAAARVYFPTGTYRVTGALSVSSSQANQRNLILHGDSTASVIAFSGGGYLSLNKSNYSSDFVLRDLSFTSDGNAATKVVFSVARGEVRNCTFTGFDLALEVNQAYQLIQHNTFISCTTGIKNIDRAVVSGAYYNANAINNNFFAQCGTGVALQHTPIGSAGSLILNPVTLYQNTFETCTTAGIRLSWVNNITIDCCYFELTPINIYADSFSKNILIQNIHSHPGEKSIKLDEAEASVSGGRLRDLELTNNSTLTGVAPSAGALGTVTIDATSKFYRFKYDGIYTPTITGSSVAGTTTYAAQFGDYVRMGNLVYVTFNIAYTATTGSGDLQISLPFPIKTQTGLRATGSIQVSGYNSTATAGSLTLYGASGGQFVNIYLSEDDVPWQVQPLTSESATFVGSIVYITEAD